MDIDIDFQPSFDPSEVFVEAVKASMVSKDGKLIKHPAGAYFQKIPTDCVTGLAAIPYEQAEALGYTKIDFLHLNLLDFFQSKDEIRELVNKDPNWDLLRSKSVVEKLFQLGKHFDVVEKIKPQNILDLADCVAVIRPGKRYLLDEYDPANKSLFRSKLYKKHHGSYSYKKGHAISYAQTIILQLHLIQRGVL